MVNIPMNDEYAPAASIVLQFELQLIFSDWIAVESSVFFLAGWLS